MSVILSLLGIVVAAAGIAAIGFGIPINEFTLGTTLIIVGTTALTGGLVLIGLAAVVGELGRVGEALRTRTVARSAARPAEEPVPSAAPAILAPAAPAVSVGARAPGANVPVAPRPRAEAPVREARPLGSYPAAPAPSAATDVSASAIERLRSGIARAERPRAEPSIVAEHDEVPLSPNGADHQRTQQAGAVVVESVPEPKVTPEDRTSAAAVETLKSSRLDFLFRSKPARPAAQAGPLDATWPSEARTERPDLEPQPVVDGVRPQAATAPSVQDRPSESAPAEEPHTAAILKSGVVDGMAYTLYADGSIEAKLPHGTVRFGSIAELRAHIESNS
jgi:hypothetical protein